MELKGKKCKFWTPDGWCLGITEQDGKLILHKTETEYNKLKNYKMEE